MPTRTKVISAFSLLLVLLLPTLLFLPVHSTTVFSDGFESGNFNAWTGTVTSGGPEGLQPGGNLYVTTANPYTGTYSAAFDFTGGSGDGRGAYCYITLSSALSSINMREYVYWSSGSISNSDVEGMKIMCLSDSNSQNYVMPLVYNDNGTYYWAVRRWSGGWATTVSSTTVSSGQWYCVEITATSSSYTLYVNGNSVLTESGLSMTSEFQICKAGNVWSDAGNEVFYIDDVVVADSYIGPIPPPLSVSISPSSAVIDVGQSQNFTSNVSGGTSPYSYQWYLNGSQVSEATSNTWNFTPNSTGTYEIYTEVTDSAEATAQSNTAQLTVNTPIAVTISPSSAVIDTGQSIYFTSSAEGGTPPFSYQWYLNGAPVNGATGVSWLTPLSTRTYHVYLIVTDSLSTLAASSTSTVTVSPPPTVSINPASATLDIGQSETFTSNPANGTSPYSYQWYLNSAPVSDATNQTWTFTPISTGAYQIYLVITDNASTATTSNTANLNVNPAPSVSITPTSALIYVDQSQQFNSSVSGGTSPFFYQWYLNGTLVSGATNPTWAFTPTIAGSYTVYVNVTDSVGAQAASGSATATVNSILIHDVAVTNVTSSKTVVSKGYSLNITVTVGNPGDYPETFNTALYANATAIGNITITNLPDGTHISIVYVWNTAGFAYGNYTISAYVSLVPGETNTASNTFTGGAVTVTIPGDVDGNGVVNMSDIITILKAFGSTIGQPHYNPNCDIANNGMINMGDIVAALRDFGQHNP